jgi:hypothetical protein
MTTTNDLREHLSLCLQQRAAWRLNLAEMFPDHPENVDANDTLLRWSKDVLQLPDDALAPLSELVQATGCESVRAAFTELHIYPEKAASRVAMRGGSPTLAALIGEYTTAAERQIAFASTR